MKDCVWVPVFREKDCTISWQWERSMPLSTQLPHQWRQCKQSSKKPASLPCVDAKDFMSDKSHRWSGYNQKVTTPWNLLSSSSLIFSRLLSYFFVFTCLPLGLLRCPSSFFSLLCLTSCSTSWLSALSRQFPTVFFSFLVFFITSQWRTCNDIRFYARYEFTKCFALENHRKDDMDISDCKYSYKKNSSKKRRKQSIKIEEVTT